MNDMLHRTSRPPVLGVCVAILALLVALLGWQMSSFMNLQNRNLTSGIQSARQQIEQSRPVDQQLNNLLNLLGQYIKATGDQQNVLELMRRAGIRLQDASAASGAQQQSGAPSGSQPAAPGVKPR
jgi:hypothetical protein